MGTAATPASAARQGHSLMAAIDVSQVKYLATHCLVLTQVPALEKQQY